MELWKSSLSFLIDTNVLIAAEPRVDSDVETGAEAAVELIRRVTAGGHRILIHPSLRTDLERDPDLTRRRARLLQQGKYPVLVEPPPVPPRWRDARFTEGDNHHVDLLLLAALEAHAASFLVTEDQGLHRRAARFGLGGRVMSVGEALEHLRALAGRPTVPPPAVSEVAAHSIDPTDPILDSLRVDYPEFDRWFARVREEQRRAFVIREPDGKLAALCIMKDESTGNDAGLPGRVLKISTFKVASPSGRRFGELLLKALFAKAQVDRYDGMYVTVFAESHPALVTTLERFGFSTAGSRTSLGEHILTKRFLTPQGRPSSLPEDPLEFHRVYGPPALHPTAGTVLIVPIRQEFSRRLFPDASPQHTLMAPEGYGNGILKAYLSRTPRRDIASGDILAFYESAPGSARALGVFAVGVVERVEVSDSPERIAEAVGTRTVYSLEEIHTMTTTGEVTALLFRHDRSLRKPIALDELIARGALSAPPQSITEVREEGAAWLRSSIQR